MSLHGRILAPALAAAALAACGSPRLGGPFGRMMSVEEAALAECREPLEARLCKDRGPECWDEVRARYEGLPEVAARKRFLIDNGCPSPRVEAWLPDYR